MTRAADRLPIGANLDGTLDTECWCGANIIPVPKELVRSGKTAQCQPGCYIGGPVLDRIRPGHPRRTA